MAAPIPPFALPTPQGSPQAAPPAVPYLAAVPAYAPPQAAAPVVVPAPVEAPKKKGRPKKVAAAAAAPAPSIASSAYAEPPIPVPAEVPGYPALSYEEAGPDVLPAYAHRAGFTLYIGCAPVGGKITNALIYVNAAHDAVRKTRGVAHHRDMEFGKGPGELCKELESLLELCEGTENVPSGDVFLGNTQVEEDTSSVWISKAAKVVRAFR